MYSSIPKANNEVDFAHSIFKTEAMPDTINSVAVVNSESKWNLIPHGFSSSGTIPENVANIQKPIIKKPIKTE